MIQINVGCQNCGQSLMDAKHPVDGQPSIGVGIILEGERHELWLSSLYGSYNIESMAPVPEGKVVVFLCPHCGKDMTVTRNCEDCKAPMIGMSFLKGGVVEICSRKGCKKHLIEFEDPEVGLRAFYDSYPLFFRGQ
jgi:hypothetical protein